MCCNINGVYNTRTSYMIDKVLYSVLVRKKEGSYMYQQSKGYKMCHVLKKPAWEWQFIIKICSKNL